VEGRLWAVPFLRSTNQGVWTREEGEALRALAPHFERMLGLASKLAARSAATTLDLLERLDCAAMLLDWRGLVLRANARAEGLIGEGLHLLNGRLAAADHRSNAALERLIALAVTGRTPSTLGSSEPVVIARPERRPLLVDAIPASDLLADTFLYTRALLLVTDLDERRIPSAERMRATFGLTAAESRVAAAVGAGAAPREAAASLGITEETARTTLKRVFEKADVKRQSELAALLARLS
jgi:DNA-binding CsgD family transcriptional regulator